MKHLRSTKIKRETARKYDALADAYDRLYGEEQEAKIRAALKSINFDQSDIVLDVGCGTGILFHHLEERIHFLVGVDISARLLRKAQYKSGRSQKISLVRADADRLPFLNEIFDKIFAVTVLQNMPDAKVTLHEIKGILKKDGALVVTGLKKSFTKERLRWLLREADLELTDFEENGHLLGYIAICRRKNRYK